MVVEAMAEAARAAEGWGGEATEEVGWVAAGTEVVAKAAAARAAVVVKEEEATAAGAVASAAEVAVAGR